MRKLGTIQDSPDGRDYTISLVPWGPIKRWTKGREAKTVFGFVPRYEMGILRRRDFLNPFCVFHFADKVTAQQMYDKIAQALIQDGLHGKPLASVVRDADPKKVSSRWAPDWQPMNDSDRFEKGEITESEAAVYKARLQQYGSRIE